MIATGEEYRERLEIIQNSTVTDYGTVFPSSESRFTIDLNTRQIIIPSEFGFLATKNEHNAETIYFVVDRYFDDADLSTKTCVVQFVNGSNSGIYAVTSMDITSIPDKIIFEWKIGNSATRLSGDINFGVRFYSIENSNFTYNLVTLAAKSLILDTLSVDADSAVQFESGQVESILERLGNLEEGGTGVGGGTGTPGSDGATFTPSVDSNGNLSWTNNKGLTNPATVNIKGIKGDTGPQGIQGETGTNGQDGADATLTPVSQETATNKEIKPNTFYQWGEITSLTISFTTPEDLTIVNEYMFEFVSGATATTLTLPATVSWVGGTPSIDANKKYQVSIVNNVGVIVGV